MEKKTYQFKAIEFLSLENSFGIIKQDNNVELTVTLGINSDTYGWFEIYDTESGGDEWYAEGGLWFNNKELVDYDGVYCLPISVIKMLQQLGYQCED